MLALRVACVLALVAIALSAPVHNKQQYQALFRHYIKQHNKHYHVDEFHVRFANFKANLDMVAAHNAGNKSFKLAVNQFADMQQEEFRSKYLGYKVVDRAHLRAQNVEEANLTVEAPAAVNWVTNGAVTPVKNQGQCGSCWAFSTTGATEGAWFISKGALVSLSEQQLVDCSSAQGNQGCNGGLMDQGFQFIITNGGLCTEADYPYTGADGTCQTTCAKTATISTFTDVKVNDETALQTANAQQPIAIAIEADQSVFQFYSSGVLDDASCGVNLDHGVLLAGYGNDSTSGKDFWLVKNSWGASWGAQGYIQIVRNVNGQWARQCGLTSAPSYPTV
jgi:C1A family cysteine protease